MSFYTKEKLEFLTISVETCKFLEQARGKKKRDFVLKTTKLLPLLYLKTQLLPSPDEQPDESPERFVTEMDYEQIRSQIADLLGETDGYLDSFDTDMAFSETTIYATISEDLADMYQSLKDFVSCCQVGDDSLSELALAVCLDDFANHWGTRLLGALRALHVALPNIEDEESEKE